MPLTEPRRGTLPSLTGMRFIAAFMVFCGHAMSENVFRDDGVNGALVNPSLAASFTGVGFFFVLSGFVLTWSARENDTRRLFWRRRFWRIYPTHFVTWAASAVIAFAAGNVVAELMNLPSLFLLHAVFPRPFAINKASWSLSVEVFFYLLFPLLLRWVRRIRAERLWFVAGVVIAAIVAVALVVDLAVPSLPWMDPLHMSWTQLWLVYSLPPVRTLEFVLGIIMARIVLSGRWIPLRLGPAVALLLAGYAVKVFTVTSTYGVVIPTVIPLALLIPAAASADLAGTPSVFRAPVMVWLGRISFAFFMTHFLVLHFGRQFVLGERTFDVPGGVSVLLVILLVTVLVSWLVHRFVEQPCMRRWSTSRKKPQAPLPEVPGFESAADRISP